MKRPCLVVLALLVAASAPACAPRLAAPPASTPLSRMAPAERDTAWVSDVLYFGRSVPGGGTVADADWETFLREVITPRFPAGLTVWAAQGQWRGPDGTVVREDTRVVQLVHPPAASADSAVARVVAEYRRRFRQESVLRVRSRVEVSF
jgi:hypothetical protein